MEIAPGPGMRVLVKSHECKMHPRMIIFEVVAGAAQLDDSFLAEGLYSRNGRKPYLQQSSLLEHIFSSDGLIWFFSVSNYIIRM